ncbi:aminodeoxychorismate synthase [Xylariales sp. PMI_506]|nr:aminodeoxychorismate synthase [Xylariales sp. PMI_506]
MSRPKVLFVDAYDSYSNNVVSLLTTLLHADVDILHIDSPRFSSANPGVKDELNDELRRYDAVVCGPGPGSPDVPSDVGLMRHIWELEGEHLLPVLGICLGFQSLAVSCGAAIKKIPGGGLHGMIRNIDFQRQTADNTNGNIFRDVPNFKATLYHSLCADIGQASISEDDWPLQKWATPPLLHNIMPLAWVEESLGNGSERILMSMKHKSKPFWGVQYHPESICSDTSGHQVISNWFQEARNWATQHGRVVVPGHGRSVDGPTRSPLLGETDLRASGFIDALTGYATNCQYIHNTIPLPAHIEVPHIVELLQSEKRDRIILDSASAHADRIGLDVRGRYSIIALDVDDALRFEYHVGDTYVSALLPSSLDVAEQQASRKVQLKEHQTIWHLLAEFMDRRKMSVSDVESPFLGGFMGYTTYELGLECIGVETPQPRGHHRPDLSFAWITKSVVIDHLEGTMRIQCLNPSVRDAMSWVRSITAALEAATLWTDGLRMNDHKLKSTTDFTPPITPTLASNLAAISTPDALEYEAKVRQCQDFIAAGDSYELCLTDQTTITRTRSLLEDAHDEASIAHSWAPPSASKTPNSWQLYRSLRARQPAPFGSYIHLGSATLISSSPERFVEYSASGLCSMRPMKGTVRKSAGTATTLAEAEALLHVPKEEAENLMIVDLVRHDLHSVCGPGRVQVPDLLKVEEYASVFSMISVVEGHLPDNDRYTGLDVLAASLPPGSMTGAPKKRSCEILRELEGHCERSLYSGVVGYMDVTGHGDWSVTIRSLFRWDDISVGDGSDASSAGRIETWRIGAGGAVTALSTPAGERDEMFTKLKGPLGIFNDERS